MKALNNFDEITDKHPEFGTEKVEVLDFVKTEKEVFIPKFVDELDTNIPDKYW